MNLIARLVRFLFWVLIVSWGIKVAGRVIAKLLQPGESSSPLQPGDGDSNTTQARQLVRDPVCGVHIAEAHAIPLQENGRLLHFCSTTCRDQYSRSQRTLAASG